jgi:hypothetical protein
MLIILFKLRTATLGLILGKSACLGSLSTPGDTAQVLFTPGVCTVVVLSDTLGGVASLFGASVLRLVNISVQVSIAAFNLLPVLRNDFAAAGFFNASASSSIAVDALVGMLYFSGKKTTVSETLVPLVFGM